MFSHVFLGSNDLVRAKKFYDAILGALGAAPGAHDAEKGRVFFQHNGGMLIIGTPINGQPASAGNGETIGFAMTSPAQVEAWHAAGLANGGTTCEDPPGQRAGMPYYLAYLRDPDGHKLCALHVLAQ